MKKHIFLLFLYILFTCCENHSVDKKIQTSPDLADEVGFSHFMSEDEGERENLLKRSDFMDVSTFNEFVGENEKIDYELEDKNIYIIGKRVLERRMILVVFFYNWFYHAHLIDKNEKSVSYLKLTSVGDPYYYRYSTLIGDRIAVVDDYECFSNYLEYSFENGEFTLLDERRQEKPCEEYDPT